MADKGPEDVPVNAEDHGAYYVWDLRPWDGDVETLDEINQAWMNAHGPDEKIGTISVFPNEVIIDDSIQDFIAEGWNEASKATDLQYLAIVAEGLKALAVQNQIDVPFVEMEAFDTVEEAVEWMDEQVA